MEDEYSQLDATEPRRPEKPAEEEVGVDVPHQLVEPATLEQLIKTFVLREGTDYGVVEATLDRKVNDIRRQLEKGDLKIVFDLATESFSIVSAHSKLK